MWAADGRNYTLFVDAVKRLAFLPRNVATIKQLPLPQAFYQANAMQEN